MDTQQQILVEQRLTNEKKSIGIAYALWFFLGRFGGHRFYLGKTTSAVIMLVSMIIGIVTSAIFIGFFIVIAVGIWALIDAFLIPGIVARDQNEKRARIMSEVSAFAVTTPAQ